MCLCAFFVCAPMRLRLMRLWLCGGGPLPGCCFTAR